MSNFIKAKSLLDYNNLILPQLNQICEPLHVLGISNFAYGKITKDKRYFRIGTHDKYTKLFYNLDLYNKFKSYRGYVTADTFTKPSLFQSFLWDTHASKNCCSEIRLAAGMWNGISFYRTTPDYIETWAFGGTPEDTQLANFYLNNMDLLDRFIEYFKFMGQDIIDISDNNKTVDILFHDPAEQSLFSLIDPKKITKFNEMISAVNIILSPRQRDCAQLLAEGIKTKDIARLLQLSPRTIETHIDILKNKFQAKNRAQLVGFLSKR
jgi:DNA-binding CsgD family transcriptional regulator